MIRPSRAASAAAAVAVAVALLAPVRTLEQLLLALSLAPALAAMAAWGFWLERRILWPGGAHPRLRPFQAIYLGQLTLLALAGVLLPVGALLAGAALWAVAMGAQESIYKAAVARLVPPAQRGRAYGLFFAGFGVAWFVGSTAMGWLYEHSRPGLVTLAVVAQLAAAPVFLVAARGIARPAQR
ncbi:MAG: hypothetical protein ACXWLA_13250 [Myxococcaceae bacterium]